MIYEKIDLYKYFGIKRKSGAVGYLTAYVPDNKECSENRKRPAMLVIPGGGYIYVSARESEPIAMRFNSLGYSAFVLDYSVKPLYFPTQLIEACMAMAYIRQNAKKYAVDVEHVCAVGFSAGGHLTGMLATLYSDDTVKNALKDAADLTRPDAVILSYPVITGSLKYRNEVTMTAISAGKKNLIQKLSLEKLVNENSSPAFIWHTMNDDVVPVQNSLLMASAYAEHGVPFELHIFEKGIHGLSVATQETTHVNKNAAVWIDLANNWLESRGFKIID